MPNPYDDESIDQAIAARRRANSRRRYVPDPKAAPGWRDPAIFGPLDRAVAEERARLKARHGGDGMDDSPEPLAEGESGAGA